jgi:SAM-dependent methyltransferase
MERFYLETVQRLVQEGWLDRAAEVLVVAGSQVDRDVLAAAGLRSVTISNCDEQMRYQAFAPYRWSLQDAEQLSFPNGSFDVGVVHQGLHHCRSPHRALTELYRVARHGIVVIEPHETLLTRLGVRLGLGQRYEVAAVRAHSLRHGGVQNTGIPNFVYRWNRQEVHKVLAAYDPVGEPRLRCFYDLRLPVGRLADERRAALRIGGRVAVPLARAVLSVLPRQANAIALVADKLDPRRDLHPWLVAVEGEPVVDPDWVGARYLGPDDSSSSGREPGSSDPDPDAGTLVLPDGRP